MFTLLAIAAALNVPTDSISRSIDLDEVHIISSVKETGNLRQQPSAVSILGQQQLADNHVTSLKGITSLAPNFYMPDYGSRLTSAIYIRGIGSRINTPAVGMYVDNVPYADKSAFDFNFYDVERIDIMRGPQATLYGRNAMGGIVRVFTKNPMAYNGTDVKLGYASGDNHRSLAMTHYQRLSDVFAMSAGGYYEGGDGFFTHDITGKKVDAMAAAGGRLRAIYAPTQRFSLDATASFDYSDEGAYPYYYEGKITANRESSYRRAMANVGLNAEYRADTWQMNAVTGYQYLDDRMMMDQDFIALDLYTLEQKQRINTINEEITFKSLSPFKGGSGRVQWQWLSGINVMYQTLHTDGPVNFYEDGVSSLIEGNTNRVFEGLKQQYPKMPTMSMALQNRQFEVTSDMQTPQFSAAAFHQSTLSVGHFDLTLGARLEYNSRHLDYLSGTSLLYDFTIAMSPMMTMPYKDLIAEPKREGRLTDDDLELLPKAALKFNIPNSQSNIYASASKGYRCGGYNVQMFSDIIQGDMRSAMMLGINEVSHGMMERFVDMDAMTALADVAQVAYKPEYSWNYELGTHLLPASGRLSVDAALFYINTYDQQIARFAPSGFGRMMVNAGESRSMGAELSARCFIPTGSSSRVQGSLLPPSKGVAGWVLALNYGYTYATFTNYDDGSGRDYTGNYVPFVPKHTVNADVAYTWMIPEWMQELSGGHINSVTLGVNYMGAGRIYWTEANDKSQSYYSTLGARLAVTMPHATVTLWTRNLTGTKYDTFYFESASRGFAQHAKPAQVGIDLSLKL